MTLWIIPAVYLAVGAIIAGVSLEIAKRNLSEVSALKLFVLFVFWPLILAVVVPMGVIGAFSKRK